MGPGISLRHVCQEGKYWDPDILRDFCNLFFVLDFGNASRTLLSTSFCCRELSGGIFALPSRFGSTIRYIDISEGMVG